MVKDLTFHYASFDSPDGEGAFHYCYVKVAVYASQMVSMDTTGLVAPYQWVGMKTPVPYLASSDTFLVGGVEIPYHSLMRVKV